MIVSLLENLEQKKSTFKTKNPILPNLFMLNNLSFVIKKIEAYGLENMFPEDDKSRLSKIFIRESSEYLEAIWGKITSFELVVQEEKSGGVKKSTKEEIKKFFNVIRFKERFDIHNLPFRTSIVLVWISRNIIKKYR